MYIIDMPRAKPQSQLSLRWMSWLSDGYHHLTHLPSSSACCKVRRLCLVGIFILIRRGSITQLVIGTVFCAVYLLLQVHCSPFSCIAICGTILVC